jgi:hypothetical protein
MFLTYIPFKGCQGRANRSSIVHAVSYFSFFFAYKSHFSDNFHFSKVFENFILHAHRMHFENFEFLREFEYKCKKALAP